MSCCWRDIAGPPPRWVEVELLGLIGQRRPRPVLQFVARQPALELGVTDERGETDRFAVHPEVVAVHQPRQPLQTDLGPVGRCVRQKQDQHTADKADVVELATVGLDQADDLRQQLVSHPRPQSGLDAGQLVDGQVGKRADPPTAGPPVRVRDRPAG